MPKRRSSFVLRHGFYLTILNGFQAYLLIRRFVLSNSINFNPEIYQLNGSVNNSSMTFVPMLSRNGLQTVKMIEPMGRGMKRKRNSEKRRVDHSSSRIRKHFNLREKAGETLVSEKATIFRPKHSKFTVEKTADSRNSDRSKQQIVVEDLRNPSNKEDEEEYEEIIYYEEYDEDVPTEENNAPLAVTSFFLNVESEATTVESTSDTEIINTLLNRGYDWRVRPPGTNLSLPGSHGPVVVSVNMLIRSISKIDDVNMEYSVQMTFRESWVDGRLAYGLPRDGKPDFIILTAGQQIWMPDSFFQNEKQAQKHMIDKPNVLIRVHKDGQILYSVRISLVLSCPMHLQYYPMDVQTCLIDLASYAYTSDDIEYQWKAVDPVQLKDGLESSLPSFQLGNVNTTYCTSKTTTGSYSCLRTVLQLRRQFSYYLLQFYIPSTMLVIVSWVSFWLDRTAVPARVTLGVTTLLTMTTQASGINAKLPPVSYSKAIDIWCGACLTFIFSALLEFACVTYMASRMFYKTKKKSSAFVGLSTMGNVSALSGALTLAPPRSIVGGTGASLGNNGNANRGGAVLDNPSDIGASKPTMTHFSPNVRESIFQRRHSLKSTPLILPNYKAIEKDETLHEEEDVWIKRRNSQLNSQLSPRTDSSTHNSPLPPILISTTLSPPPASNEMASRSVAAHAANSPSPSNFGGDSEHGSFNADLFSPTSSTVGLGASSYALTYRNMGATDLPTVRRAACNRDPQFCSIQKEVSGGPKRAASYGGAKTTLDIDADENAELLAKNRGSVSAISKRRSSSLQSSRNWLRNLALFRWFFRQFDIEDRAKRADYISRLMFPVVFLIFNIVYWLSYSRYQITLPWS